MRWGWLALCLMVVGCTDEQAGQKAEPPAMSALLSGVTQRGTMTYGPGLVITAGPEQASVPDRFHGAWGDTPRACEAGGIATLTISATEILFAGGSVAVSSVSPLEDAAVAVFGQGDDDGRAFEANVSLQLETDGASLKVGGADGLVLSKCGSMPLSELADAAPAPVTFPEATGPVADYFKAELPASYVGRWAADAAACAGANVLEVRTQALSFGGETLELGDIEVNESNGQIVNLIAPTDTGARVMLRLSTDGAWLNVSAMGTPLATELPGMVGRCP